MEQLTIKQIRVGMNMTQKSMANFLNISAVTYRKKEKGITKFTFDEVRKICNKANVSIDLVK
jgi:DNA-binding XRE family transcriptional regulator